MSHKKVRRRRRKKKHNQREKNSLKETEWDWQRERKSECYVTLSSRSSAKTWLGLPLYYDDRAFLMEQIKQRSSGWPADAWWIPALPAPTNCSKTPQCTLYILPEDTETYQRTAASRNSVSSLTNCTLRWNLKGFFIRSVFSLAEI